MPPGRPIALKVNDAPRGDPVAREREAAVAKLCRSVLNPKNLGGAGKLNILGYIFCNYGRNHGVSDNVPFIWSVLARFG